MTNSNLIQIEQSEEQGRCAGEFTQNAAIQSVRMARSLVVADAERFHRAPVGSLATSIGFGVGSVLRSEAAIGFTTDFTFSIRRVEETEDTVALVEINCSLESQYAIRPGFTPNDEQLAAFHRAGAVLHAWPYFREFTQSSVVRTGLPAPPVPLLCLVAAPKQLRSASSSAPPKRRPRRLKPAG
jgi:hypothetical protein